MGKKKSKDQSSEKESLAQIHREIFKLIKNNQKEGDHWEVDTDQGIYALFRKKKNVMVLIPEDIWEDMAIPFKDFFKIDEAKIILEKLVSGDFISGRSLFADRM